MTGSTARFPIALALAGMLVLPGVAPGQGEAEGLSASFRKASQRALPAVVTVRPEAVPGPFEPAPEVGPFVVPVPFRDRDAGGSGVVIDAAKGLILTNDHVVQASPRVVVTLPDGRERAAKEVRRDPKSDLALVVIDPAGLALKQADWGDSDALDTGDWVLAVGQPFGLSGTVTAGIVSGKGRGIGVALYEDLIQTDAAINPGNSGGPLVNLKGEIVGINTAIKTRNGGSEGVGFAVPSARARRVADDLARLGRVRRSYIGVGIRRIDPALADRVGQGGAVPITGVAVGGPADKAGLRPGDVVLAVGGKPLRGGGSLQGAIEVAPAGEALGLTIWRDGRKVEVPVTPEAQPDALGLPEAAPPAAPAPAPAREVAPRPAPGPVPEPRRPESFPAVGLRLAEPTAELARRFGLDPEVKGLVVVGVEPDSPADRGGLEVGNVVTDAGRRRVAALADFRAALAKRPEGHDLILRILKGSKPEFRVLIGPAADDPSRNKDKEP
ncbi:MAG TPA: trypsin-like peptidase domain-containing protein [Isosphaeraceae bacterium]|nr:trypsin-like peptidase domain-containing protein [Isosphaeraceae bacterium]